jgi:hypothetical protein
MGLLSRSSGTRAVPMIERRDIGDLAGLLKVEGREAVQIDIR